MAEPLKHQLGPDLPGRVAASLAAAMPELDVAAFERFCLDGWEDLALTPRGARISDAMAEFLPADRAAALEILLRSLDHSPAIEDGEADNGWASWFYLPHTHFVGEHCLDQFDLAMRAQHELTKRFTAEFSIRPFITRHRERTLKVLSRWTGDDSEHVRRLVSEGTRPRLPWAPVLREFVDDPTAVVGLLEKLKDDPSEYVRRSVANNLNDIAKDHPDLVVDISERWWTDASPDRKRLVRHAMRTLVKRAHPGALAVLGFGAESTAEVAALTVTPPDPKIGDKIRVVAEITNPSPHPGDAAGALVDLVVHFVKANGERNPKVFKGGERHVEAGQSSEIRTTISLAQHSTRTHYPGVHRVEVQLNGSIVAGIDFELRE